MQSILAQTELLRQENALLQTQLEDQQVHIQMLHQPASNLDHIRQQDNDDMVEPLDHAVPLGQASHTILNSHGGHRPSDTRIPRMLVTERVDEVDSTSRRGPQPPLYSNSGNRQQMRLS